MMNGSTARDDDGIAWRLLLDKTGAPIRKGDSVEAGTVSGGKPPCHIGHDGYVWVDGIRICPEEIGASWKRAG